MITIFDHNTHPTWNPLYKLRHESKNRTNGGFTYSENIVRYHLPVMIPILQKSSYKNILISSVTMIAQDIIQKDTDLIVCYVHEFLEREYPKIKQVSAWYKGKIIYITSRANLHEKLVSDNIDSILLPMAIDVSVFSKIEKSEKHADKRVIYFGNRYLGKGQSYDIVKKAFVDKGWIFDTISNNMFNNADNLSREQIFEILAKYKYGIGEGRCVLEMNALGIKTLICASSNQGIMTNESDFDLQKMNNFSDGKVWTFSQDINLCIDNFDKAIIKTLDIKDVLPILEKQLKDIVL